jgi:branched-chain amino acid transport system substrate-binding protein
MRGSLRRWMGVLQGVGAAVVVMAMLAVGGCGGDDSDSARSGGGGAAAQSGEPIKIGVEAGLTGTSSEIGVPYLEGAMMAREDLMRDKDKVLKGREVELIEADTETEAVPSVQAALKLVNVDKVDAILCSCWTLMMLPISEALKDRDTVIISDATSSPVLRDMPGNILSTIGTDDLLGGILAEWVYGLGHEEAAMLYGNDPYGKTFKEAVTEADESAGGKIALDLKVDLELSDYGPEMKRIVDSGVDTVLMGSYTDDARLQFRQLQQLGWNGRVFQLYPTSTLFNDDPKADDHVFGVDVAHNDGPRAKAFMKRYEKEHGKEPTVWAAIGYDAAWLAAVGAANAPSDSADDIEQTIRDQAATYDGVTGRIEFDEDGVRANPDLDYFKQIDGELMAVGEDGEPRPEE